MATAFVRLFYFAVHLVFSSIDAWTNPCSQYPLKGTPTCDVTKSFEERAHNLVYVQEAKLDDPYSVYGGLSGHVSKNVTELNIPAYNWWNEALHGVGKGNGINYNGTIKYTTVFPQVITTASSFNTTLFKRIGQAISTEARAMWNNGQAGLTFWAPNVNIFRDPRWGRGQETPGEDPFLNSVYAINFVQGMQMSNELQNKSNDKYLKVSSCCKHFADYSLEVADGYWRHSFDANVSEYDQNDTYLVAFKYCVSDGAASSVMCSYNAVNGVQSCADKELLTTLLRDEWGFDGYITSDCDLITKSSFFTNDTAATVDAVFGAGMDINCGPYTQTYAADAIRSNQEIFKLRELSCLVVKVQAAMYRATLVQMRLGMFDDPENLPWSKLGVDDVATEEHFLLARDAARQGIVLLKNNDNVLPLDKTKIKLIANIGPNANNAEVMYGSYFGIAPFVYTVQDGLELYLESVMFEPGVEMDTTKTTWIATAIQAAQSADVSILVMGLDQTQEREGHDRHHLELPGQQAGCIRRVAAAAKGPVILVILSGGGVDISEFRDSDDVDAILWAGYPGMFGGEAIADVLFGTFNPTGRLTQTWYRDEYTDEVLMSDMNMRPNEDTKSPGRGYRYYPGEVVYPFGYGLSYTTFECGVVVDFGDGQLWTTVMNTGNVAGGVVVLVYFEPSDAGKDGKPLKRLIAFGKVDRLEKGHSMKLYMDVYPEFLIHGPEHNGYFSVSCPGV